MPHAGTATHLFQYVDPKNSTDLPLATGETYTGGWVETLQFTTVMLALTADQDCDYRIQFSPDTINVDSTLSFKFRLGSIEPPKRLTNTRRYYRVVVENTSGADMTELRLQTIQGHHPILNSPLNGTVTQDSDATTVRNLSFEDEVGLGRYQNITKIDKFGRNPDIDTGTVPEDVWTVGGVYTGFVDAAEEFQIVLSNAADIGGIVTFNYLESTTSTAYKTAEITTTGLTTNTGITGLRSNRMSINLAQSTANAGLVTLRHRTTTANVFNRIEILKGQSELSAFTVPANNKAQIRNLVARLSNKQDAVVDIDLYIKELGKSPRLISEGTASQNSTLIANPFGGFTIEGFADFVVRVTSTTVNSVIVYADFTIILVDED